MPLTEYHDDLSISDNDFVWRRIPPLHIVRDDKGGCHISSAAFSDDRDGDPMSVHLESIVMKNNWTEQDLFEIHNLPRLVVDKA